MLITAATGPLWVFLPIVILYTFYYDGIEIILIAVLVDAYFGYGHTSVPWYTVAALGLLILVRFLRPYVSMYNR